MKIIRLGEIPEELYGSIGGKALGLDKLIKKGFKVPRGFLITETDFILFPSIFSFFDNENYTRVSVRSSSSTEDGENFSSAGQYETVLNVTRDGLEDAITKCLQSMNGERAEKYAENFCINEENKMNIVIQEMVDSEKSGVVFTECPTNPTKILVECVRGLGENLVSGSVSANMYELDRDGFDGEGDNLLTKEELENIYNETKRILDTFEGESDLEWAIKEHELYFLQMRPITTKVTAYDLNEFDKKEENLENHLYTNRNVGEMLPGVVTPLSLSTSVLAIDYGIRDMFYFAHHLKSVNELPDLYMITSCYGHLFFDMKHFYDLNKSVLIAHPQQLNLSIMGEYYDSPKVEGRKRIFIKRAINSIRFFKYLYSFKKTRQRLIDIVNEIKFSDTEDINKVYEEITNNLHYMNESLSCHYVSSSYSGSTTSTLFLALKKYFKDKNDFHAVMAEALSDIPGIESVDILTKLQNLSNKIKEEKKDSLSLSEYELLDYIKNRASNEVKQMYKEFILVHGHRSIKEAELRSKAWKNDEISLMKYLKSIMSSPANLEAGNKEVDLNKIFGFCKGTTRKFAVTYAKRAREAVVEREFSKSKMIKIIDFFKDQYIKLSKLLVKASLLEDEDSIYFLTHKEIGELIKGNKELLNKIKERKIVFALQEKLSFKDVYIGKPYPIEKMSSDSEKTLKGVPACKGLVKGIAHVVLSVDDANNLKEGEIMVAKFTDIGWSPYYSLLKGLVTEVGSSLSHGAVVAREYGLPSLVNVSNATSIIHSGDLIELDAINGCVNIL